MKALAGLPGDVRRRLEIRMRNVLNDLLDQEATIKATSYDADRPTGHFESAIPRGVNIETGIPPAWVSPYHHFRARLAAAATEHEFRHVLRAARKRVDELESPGTMATSIGGTNWEEIEYAILDQGVGMGAVQLAAAFEVSADLVRQIRDENDHDPETGIDNGPDKFAVRKAREMHFVDKMSADQIAPVLRKSRATIYRYLQDTEGAAA